MPSARTPQESYPKRESHFAHKLTRLVWRACAAQEIGIPAAFLVVQIAHTEDAKRYSGAVTYWNDQLQSLMGLSWDQLNRIRKKAVTADWLHYEPGGKGKVGRYWTTIPPAYSEFQDGAVDEDFIRMDAEASADKTPESPALMRTEARDKFRENLGTNLEHSTLRPKPSPNPTKAHAAHATATDHDDENDGKPKLPPDEAAFQDEFWPVVSRKAGKQSALAAFKKARKRRSDYSGDPAGDRAYLVERMTAFAASPKAKGKYNPYPATWLNGGHYDDDPAEWERSDEQNRPIHPSQHHDPDRPIEAL